MKNQRQEGKMIPVPCLEKENWASPSRFLFLRWKDLKMALNREKVFRKDTMIKVVEDTYTPKSKL